MPQPLIRPLAVNLPSWLILALTYFIAGRLGLMLAVIHESATAVWPPTGIAIAACLLGGTRMWPGVFAGAFLVNLTTAGSIASSLGIALGNSLEGVIGAWLVARYARGQQAFERAQDTFKFAGLMALACVISATIGVASLLLTGFAELSNAPAIWSTWWLGDTTGAVIVAPLLIAWAAPHPSRTRGGSWVEAACLVAAVAAVTRIVFGGAAPFGIGGGPLAFFCLPVVLWSALRFGARGAATTTLAISAAALWGTLNGQGPFLSRSPHESLLWLQSFMGVIAVMGLTVAAVVEERRQAEEGVRRLNEDLERRVDLRTTELESARSALEQSHARLLEAQRVAQIGSWDWDIPGNRIWWSDELHRIYGLQAEVEMTYARFLERVHPDDRAHVDASISDALREKRAFGFEHRIVRPDGEILTLYGRGRVVLDDRAAPIRMVGTGQDITERKRAQEQHAELLRAQDARREAERANRLKDEFLAVVSHELRTPLNAILGWSRLLETGVLPEDKAARGLETIRRNAQMQARLIDDILEVSKMMTSNIDLNLTEVESRSTVLAAVDAVRPMAGAKDIQIACDIEAGPVVADPTRLQQMVWNLLVNAVKFTPPHGEVRLRLRRLDGQIEIEVSDNGAGIAPGFLPYVFDRFRQADSSTTRRHGGLGLGLHIVRHLAELHGGTVRGESPGEGHGATFTITLPVPGPVAHTYRPPAPRDAISESTRLARDRPLDRRRVLVVDDDREACDLLTAVLTQAGAEVIAAASAADAMRELTRQTVDIMLVDIGMPGQDGYGFIAEIRAGAIAQATDVPAVAVTAYARDEDVAKALAAGFDRHVAKPLEPSAVIGVVAALIADLKVRAI